MTKPVFALLFNGQGARLTGMGLDFAQAYPAAQAVYQVAEAATGYPLRQWLAEESDLWQETRYAQVGMAATSLAIYAVLAEVLKDLGLKPAYMAGLSLGEYSALLASGSLSLSQGFALLKERGERMSQVCEQVQAQDQVGMAAVMRVPLDQVEAFIAQVYQDHAPLYLANDNSSQQQVLGGSQKALESLDQVLKQAGYRSALPLKLEGPFHTPYMARMEEDFLDLVQSLPWQKPEIPVLSNTTLDCHHPDQTPQWLTQHLTQRVRWRETITYLSQAGVTHCLQIGPGSTLADLMRREAQAPACLVVETCQDLDGIQEFLTKE